MNRRMRAALDRYITGNWGEDSVPDVLPCCEECEEQDDCDFDDTQCTILKSFYDSMDEPCYNEDDYPHNEDRGIDDHWEREI